jgi:hypothetical protein
VSDLEGFVKAVGPGRVIVLEGGGIRMPEFQDSGSEIDIYNMPDDYGNPYIRWGYVFDGYELTITGVTGLTIRGGGNGHFALTNAATYACILRFENCEDIAVENVIAGHSANYTSGCDAGVFSFEDCRDVTIRRASMYGCGAEGLWLYGVDGLTVEDSEIYECSVRLLTVNDSANITFRDVTFRDTGERNLVFMSESENLLFEDCVFRDNRTGYNFSKWNAYTHNYYYIFETADNTQNVIVRGCEFISNDTFALSNEPVDADHVRFEDCVFTGNTFEGLGKLREGVWIYTEWSSYDWSVDLDGRSLDWLIDEIWKGNWSGYILIREAEGDVLPDGFPLNESIEAAARIARDARNNDRPFFEVDAAPEGSAAPVTLISMYIEPAARGIVYDNGGDSAESYSWIGNFRLTAADAYEIGIVKDEDRVYLATTLETGDGLGNCLVAYLYFEKD